MKTSFIKKERFITVFRKVGLISLFLFILALNEGCQNPEAAQLNKVIQDEIKKSHTLHTNVKIQDIIRKKHSNELLNARNGLGSNQDIQSFEGDTKFSQYIIEYLKKRNSKINAERFTQALMKVSQSQDYDPIFLLAVAKTESGFDFNAIGSAGEIGLMQIKPITAEWICNRISLQWKGPVALRDPEYNILVGAYYLKYLKKTFKSQSLKYINAYNMGTTSLRRMPAENLKKHPYFGKVAANYLAIYAELNKIKESIKI